MHPMSKFAPAEQFGQQQWPLNRSKLVYSTEDGTYSPFRTRGLGKEEGPTTYWQQRSGLMPILVRYTLKYQRSTVTSDP